MKLGHIHVMTIAYKTDDPKGATQARSQSKHQKCIQTSGHRNSTSHARGTATCELIYSSITSTNPFITVHQ